MVESTSTHTKSHPPASAAPGVSGKKLTLALLLALGLVGCSLSYVLWSYNRIDAAREQADQAWQGLAEPLSQHYRKLESLVAARVDSRQMPMELGERFRLAIDRFRSTAQADSQLAAALEIEAIVEIADVESPRKDALRAAIEAYNERIGVLQDVMATPGAGVVSLFLNFPEPTQFPK